MRHIRITSLIFGLLAALALGGCSPLPFATAPVERSDAALPEPSNDSAPQAPTSDGRADYAERVTMFYISSDAQQLSPLTRTLWLTSGDILIEKVMERLLESPGREDVSPIAPAGTRLLSAECSGGIATVDLSPEARNQSAQSQVFMRAAIANTLTRLDGIHSVNVLIGGQVEGVGESVSALPSGVLQRGDNNLTAIWAQVQADSERFSPNHSPRLLDVNAVLYFASTQDERLLPEIRRIRFTSDDLILPLLRELVRGPVDLSEAKAVLPEDLEPLLSAPTIDTSRDGRRLITLPLIREFQDEALRRGMSLRQVYGALTLTLCRFVPEVDGVVVRLGEQRLERIDVPGGVMTFKDGVMTPADFSSMIGDTAQIYLPTESGKLRKVSRVLDTYSATLPRALLVQLVYGPRDTEDDLVRAVPEGISTADILGVRTDGDVVLINLSSNFYRCCQSLTVLGERSLVYAIVNTMTELSGVNKVRLYVEDKLADTLVHQIYLKSELMRNPGLIEAPEDAMGS